MKHSSILSNDEGLFSCLPGRRAYAVATEPLAHALPAPSCSSAFSRVSAFPREPDSAFCGGKP
eukprot:6180342-Pleurochrysis_carterae.AAC.6